MSESNVGPLVGEVENLAAAPQLARLVLEVGRRAAVARSREIAALAPPLIADSGVVRAQADTSHGNVVSALERGARDRNEQRLLGALAARAIALEPPSGVDAEDRLVSELLWLSAHTSLDVFPFLEATLGPKSGGLWGALCDLVRRIDGGREPALDRADALVGAAALASVAMPEVRAAASQLADEVTDEALRSLLRGKARIEAPTEAFTPVVGSMQSAPRGVLVSALIALTGFPLFARGVRGLASLALAYKHPAEIVVDDTTVRIRSRTELLGKSMRETEDVLPLAQIVKASREVRFARLPLYVGLLALAIGSYFGVGWVTDGARAASPSLLAQGLLVVAAGIAIELGISAVFPGARGRCRVVFYPRKGSPICVGDLEIDAADRTLALLARPAR
jgi:hypothetical protein